MSNIVLFICCAVIVCVSGLALYEVLLLIEATDRKVQERKRWRHFMNISDLSRW